MDEHTKYSSDFVRRMFFDQAGKYRVVAFRLLDVFEGDVYWANGKYYDEKTKEQVDIGDKLPEDDAFQISMSELTYGNNTLECAPVMGSIDTPFLLPEELDTLLYLIQDWVFKKTKNRFEDFIANTMYAGRDEREVTGEKYRIGNWSLEGCMGVFEFHRTGMVLNERDSYTDVSYCITNDHTCVVAFPENEENMYCGVVSFLPETDEENRASLNLKECIDFILDNRSDQLKTALAEPETLAQLRNRMFWEAHQLTDEPIPDIAKRVQEKLEPQRAYPYSNSLVVAGARIHHEEYHKEKEFKERPKGRRKGR